MGICCFTETVCKNPVVLTPYHKNPILLKAYHCLQDSCFTMTLQLSSRILFYWHPTTVHKNPVLLTSDYCIPESWWCPSSPFLFVFVWFKFNKFWIVLSFLMQKYMILYYTIIFFIPLSVPNSRLWKLIQSPYPQTCKMLVYSCSLEVALTCELL